MTKQVESLMMKQIRKHLKFCSDINDQISPSRPISKTNYYLRSQNPTERNDAAKVRQSASYSL